MTRVAYGSSVLLTVVLQERGWQAVEGLLHRVEVDSLVPAPALTEVVVRARERGNTSTPGHLYDFLHSYGMTFVDLTPPDAIRAAELIELSRRYPGVSRTGDRLTLSLGGALILAVSERVADNILSRDGYWTDLASRNAFTIKVIDVRAT